MEPQRLAQLLASGQAALRRESEPESAALLQNEERQALQRRWTARISQFLQGQRARHAETPEPSREGAPVPFSAYTGRDALTASHADHAEGGARARLSGGGGDPRGSAAPLSFPPPRLAAASASPSPAPLLPSGRRETPEAAFPAKAAELQNLLHFFHDLSDHAGRLVARAREPPQQRPHAQLSDHAAAAPSFASPLPPTSRAALSASSSSASAGAVAPAQPIGCGETASRARGEREEFFALERACHAGAAPPGVQAPGAGLASAPPPAAAPRPASRGSSYAPSESLAHNGGSPSLLPRRPAPIWPAPASAGSLAASGSPSVSLSAVRPSLLHAQASLLVPGAPGAWSAGSPPGAAFAGGDRPPRMRARFLLMTRDARCLAPTACIASSPRIRFALLPSPAMHNTHSRSRRAATGATARGLVLLRRLPLRLRTPFLRRLSHSATAAGPTASRVCGLVSVALRAGVSLLVPGGLSACGGAPGGGARCRGAKGCAAGGGAAASPLYGVAGPARTGDKRPWSDGAAQARDERRKRRRKGKNAVEEDPEKESDSGAWPRGLLGREEGATPDKEQAKKQREDDELRRTKEERREKRERRRMQRRERRARRRARRDLVRLMRRQFIKKKQEEEERRRREAEEDEEEEDEEAKSEEKRENEDRGKTALKPRPAARRSRTAKRGRALKKTQKNQHGEPTHAKEEDEEAAEQEGESDQEAEGKEKRGQGSDKPEEEEDDFESQMELIERKLQKRLKQLSTGTVMVQRGSRHREGDYAPGMSLQRKLDYLVQHSIACPTLPNSAPLSNAYTITSRFKETNHSSMLGDAARMNLYRIAIETQIRRLHAIRRTANGHRILEIGCGPFCVLSINAARAGAKEIVALEVARRAAMDAQAFVRMYGFGEVIKVVNAYSKECAFRCSAPRPGATATPGLPSSSARSPSPEAACEETQTRAVRAAGPGAKGEPSALEERSTSSGRSSPSGETFVAGHAPTKAESGEDAHRSAATTPAGLEAKAHVAPGTAEGLQGPSAGASSPPPSDAQPAADGECGRAGSQQGGRSETGVAEQEGHGPFDLIIHEIIGDICSNEGVADVVDDIQTRTGRIPASVPYAARTWFTPCELPRPRNIIFPHHRYPLRTLLSPNRVLLQSVDVQFASLRLSDRFAPLEELLFEERMRPQLLQRREARFNCLRSGKLCGLLLCNEVEVMKGVSIDNRESAATSHWYTNVALLKREVRVRKGDVVVVHSCADLTNYQHVDVREGMALAEVDDIPAAVRAGKVLAPPSPAGGRGKAPTSPAASAAAAAGKGTWSGPACGGRRARSGGASGGGASSVECLTGSASAEADQPQECPADDGAHEETGSDCTSPNGDAAARAPATGRRVHRAAAAAGSQRGAEDADEADAAGPQETEGARRGADAAPESSPKDENGEDARFQGGAAVDDPLPFPACFGSATPECQEASSAAESGYARHYLSRPRYCFFVEIHRRVRRRNRSPFLYFRQLGKPEGKRGEGADEDGRGGPGSSRWRALLESESETSTSDDEAGTDLSESEVSSEEESESSDSEEEDEVEEALTASARKADGVDEGADRQVPSSEGSDDREGGKRRGTAGRGGGRAQENGEGETKSGRDAGERGEAVCRSQSMNADTTENEKARRKEKQFRIRRLPLIVIDFNEQSPFVDKAVSLHNCSGGA
ncbi:hypothetical protein BESB_055020 [Besnoitia besnoiti]|uniref:Uncharacterized protein n=1 Tax=Besnoitia besnoiti TaxID=94643 RepID=A0A2A9MHW9_BESBE|nr:hypothetical protein BESB_055020 [Besnoitia besnoiti]PFH35851.1 hypothetical protein BESB_055020 [Besnoitia besnoiti]